MDRRRHQQVAVGVRVAIQQAEGAVAPEHDQVLLVVIALPGLAEEAGRAYKPINEVVDTMDIAGVSKKVVAFKPIGNVKG
jgi:RNA-splicing ligase RtcB